MGLHLNQLSMDIFKFYTTILKNSCNDVKTFIFTVTNRTTEQLA